MTRTTVNFDTSEKSTPKAKDIEVGDCFKHGDYLYLRLPNQPGAVSMISVAVIHPTDEISFSNSFGGNISVTPVTKLSITAEI